MARTYWTIEVVGGAHKTAEEWGIQENTIRLELVIRNPSLLSFRAIVRDFTADPIFAEDTVLILRSGVEKLANGQLRPNTGAQEFYGIVTAVPRAATGASESLDYKVECPWFWLRNVIFQQKTYAWDGTYQPPLYVLGNFAAVDTSHVLIPYARSETEWRHLTCEEQIREVCRYVIEEAVPVAPMVIGEIEIDPEGYDGGSVPISDERDLNPEQIITQMLRFAPDGAAWIDPTTAPLPTFNCKRWANLPEVTLALGDGVIVRTQITPLHSLRVPGVILRFEKLNEDSQGSMLRLSEQKYPADANPRALRALVQTIDLIGQKTVTQEADVVVQAINAEHAIMATRVAWWREHLNWTFDERYTDFTVSDVVVESLDNPDAEPLYLPNDLLDTALPPWLIYDEETNPDGLFVERVRIRAKLGFKKWTDSTHTTLDQDRTSAERLLAIATEITSTDAVTNIYTNRRVTQEQEPEPLGLARFIYEGLNILHYSGSIEIKDKEIARTVRLGMRLNITGGRPEWASMRALVTTITHDVSTGSTMVTIGPPKFLGAKDWIEFLRTNRLRFRGSVNQPQTGRPGSSSRVSLGKATPRRNATSAPGDSGSAVTGWAVA